MKKSICIVGGEDVHKRIPLAQYLIKDGFDVTIIGTDHRDFPSPITYVSYNLNRSLSPIKDLKTVFWYQKFFKENRFDVIQTFDTKPNFLLPLALLNTKVPIVRTITGLGILFIDNSLFSRVFRNVYTFFHSVVRRRVSMTTFQNTDDRDIFKKKKLVNASNHCMIYSSGIELKNYKTIAPRNANPFTFICVSRLLYEKGILYFLKAARACKEKGYEFRYVLVGPVEEDSKRFNQSIINAYSDVVEILGKRDDVPALLLQSDAFVLPTFYREGFARVLLEAAAVGLPIISTNVVGVKEFALHNKLALLVKPKQVDELVDAMINLANNKALSNKFSTNALEHVKNFSTEKIANKYMAIFNNIIENNRI